MKKLTLWKSASDFAFANVGVTNAVTLQQDGTAAFIAGGFDQADLATWNQIASQQRQQFISLQKQKLPSEIAAANAPKADPVAEAPAAPAEAAKPA
jgi:hypothetical protein